MKDQGTSDSRIGGFFNRAIQINRIHSFEPTGWDVYAAKFLLSIQFLDVAIKIVDLCHDVKKGHISMQG
jgi:hypothetical protein